MSFYVKGAHEMKAAILHQLEGRLKNLQLENEEMDMLDHSDEGFGDISSQAIEEYEQALAKMELLEEIISDIQEMDESGRTINAGHGNSPRETLPTPFLPRSGE